MSAVMYAYKIKKQDWWEEAEKILKFYQTENPIRKIIVELFEQNADKKIFEVFQKVGEFVNKLPEKARHTSSLQLFELDEDTYLIRVLEDGYFFLNSFQNEGWKVETCFYDGRSDVTPDEEKNYSTLEWMEEQIKQRRYFLYPLVTEREQFDWVFDEMKKQMKKAV